MICCELMLSPLSRSGQSLLEKVAPISLTTQEVLENKIPNIIITPPTPGIDIKEGSLALHGITRTTITNSVPPNHCLSETVIDFGDELKATDVQVKNPITIPVSSEGSPENTSNKMSVYFVDDLKIADAELGSQINSIPKQKSFKRSIKSDRRRKKFWMPYPVNPPLKVRRKNRSSDTILNAIQILQKNNINFTITNESPYNRLPSVKMEPVAHARPVFPQAFNPSVTNFALREIPVHMSNVYTCPLNGVNLNVAENVAQEVINSTKTMQSTSLGVGQGIEDEFVHNDKIQKNNLENKTHIVTEIEPKQTISTKSSPPIEIKNITVDDTTRICVEKNFFNTEKSAETFIPSELITKYNDDAFKELTPTPSSLNISSILDFDISSEEEVVNPDGKEEVICKSQGSIEVCPDIGFKKDDGQLSSVKEVTDNCLLADISENLHESSHSNVQVLNSQMNVLFCPSVKCRKDRPPKILPQKLVGFSSQMEIEHKTFLELAEEGEGNENKEVISDKETELNVLAQDRLACSKLPLITISNVKQKKDRKVTSQSMVENVADLNIKHAETKDNISINRVTVSPTPITMVSRVKRKRGKNSNSENKIEFIHEDNNIDSSNDEKNNDTTVKNPNLAIKRKKGRPGKFQRYTSDTSDEEVGNYVMKNIKNVNKEFMTEGESSSETQNTDSDQPCIKSESIKETYSQNFSNTEIFNYTVNKTKSHAIDPGTHSPTDWSATSVIKLKKESIFTEENTGSDHPCIKSGLTMETFSRNSPNSDVFNHGLNITNSSSINFRVHPVTDWSANLTIKRDTLYDDSNLKQISKSLVHVPHINTCSLNDINLNQAKNVTEGELLNVADYIINEKTATLDLMDIEAKDNIDVNKLLSPRSHTALTAIPTIKTGTDRISRVQDKTEFTDNDNDLDSLNHKRNSNTIEECATPVMKRKRGRPPKIKTVAQLQTDVSDRSYKEQSKYVAKNKRIISKEFITDDESDSDCQQNADFIKQSVFSEKNTDSDQGCIESELTIENCTPNNEGVNNTDSSTIDPRTQSPTGWSKNLIMKKDTLCDNIDLKQVSKNNFEYFKTKYKGKAKKLAKKHSSQDKLSQTLLNVQENLTEEDFRGFDDSEKKAANSLRLTVFRQNMNLVRQICEKSDEVNSQNFIKNVQTNDNRINIVQDILITKKNAIDLISGTTLANNQRPTFRKSMSPKMNTAVDILTQVMEEMSKTGPAQKAGKMFNKPAPIYIPAVYSTPGKRKAEEVEEVREKSCEGDELFEDCPRSPDEVVIPDQLPKLIPTQKPQQMRVHKVASAINKLLSFGHETALVNEVAMQFAFQTNHFIAQVVVGKISQNCDKPDNSFPPGPPLSGVQRILLGFLIKLEKSTHPGVLDKVLELAEPQVFNRLVCTIENAQQLTRFYTAICRMRQDLDRMRRFICDSFYFSGDFAVPVLFTALTMWPNVLPMASQLSEFPLAKVIVHICYLKLCNKPGYNLMPLRDLLSRFYGYPTERWNCDELFQEILVDYIRNPSVKLSDYTLQLFLKNKPASWVSKKVHDCLIPLYEQVPNTNPNLKATLLILYGNIHYFFKAHELQFVTKIDDWFESLQQEEKDPVVQRSLIVARQRLLKCKIGSTRKRTKEPEPDKALQLIEANVDNSKVQ
ncbi:uncharacterized protein [Euwallacea fornicatus]